MAIGEYYTGDPPYNWWTYPNGYYWQPNYYQPYQQIQQGWQCPTCKRVYSPSMSMCSYCPEKPTTTTNASPPVRYENVSENSAN